MLICHRCNYECTYYIIHNPALDSNLFLNNIFWWHDGIKNGSYSGTELNC